MKPTATITIAAAALLALSAAPAAAVCSQSQLVGKWALNGSDNATWVRCTFTVRDGGAYSGRCKGTGRPTSGSVLDGTLRVNRTCVLSGTHRSGEQFSQKLSGDLEEDGSAGNGILHFGDPQTENFGNLFVMTKKP